MTAARSLPYQVIRSVRTDKPDRMSTANSSVCGMILALTPAVILCAISQENGVDVLKRGEASPTVADLTSRAEAGEIHPQVLLGAALRRRVGRRFTGAGHLGEVGRGRGRERICGCLVTPPVPPSHG